MASSNKVTYNLEAEKTLLASMISSDEVRYEAINILTEDDFYNTKSHSVIFTAIKNLENQKKPVNYMSVAQELKMNMKAFDDVGGADYLKEISDYFMGNKTGFHNLRIVNDLSLIRKLFNKVETMQNDFYTKKISDIGDYVSQFEKEITSITKGRASNGFVNSADVIDDISKDIQKRRSEGVLNSRVTGIDTGYKLLNYYLHGWQNGTLNIIGARPGVGKTALALNLLYRSAIKTKKTVVMFSLEMSAKQLANRMLSFVSNVNADDLTTGNLTDNDWLAIEEARNEISRTKILIDDTSALKIGEIKAKVMKLKATDPDLGLVVIDYLGLIHTDRPNKEHRLEIEEISRSLKELSRDANVPIICLCQLSRSSEKNNRKPMLSDLRESGSIEQDADSVIMIHRDNYQKENQDNENNPDDNTKSPLGNQTITELLLLKNRMGQPGATIKLSFLMNIGKFVDIDFNTMGE